MTDLNLRWKKLNQFGKISVEPEREKGGAE